MRHTLSTRPLVVAATLFGLAPGFAAPPAPAHGAASAVKESADPARAAAIEKAAAALKKRPPQPPVEVVRGQTEAGIRFLSGGVSQDHRAAMHAERRQYSLWVATVAQPSGAYLVDVDLQITRADKAAPPAVVLQRKLEGPWLMVALPPGAYTVAGSLREAGAAAAQTVTQRVNVPKQGQRQAVLRFKSAATVDADNPRPPQANPFGAEAASAPVR
jgi:hypothetical protein